MTERGPLDWMGWPRGDARRATWFLLASIYAISLFSLYSSWLAGGGRQYLLVMVVAAAVLLKPKAGFIAAIISLVTYVLFAVGFHQGWMTLRPALATTGVMRLVLEGAGFTLAALLIAAILWLFGRELEAAAKAKQDSRQFHALLLKKEEELETANRLAEQRAEALAAAAKIARDVNSELDPQKLLAQVAGLIRACFGYYYTGVYLLDEAGEYAILQGLSSGNGDEILPCSYQLKAGGPGMVGRAAASGEIQIVLDTRDDPQFLECPALPETRSELVLPLKARDQIIGVLDIQSRTSLEASQGDPVLSLLADQVALAISNARLFDQAQESQASFHSIVERGEDGILVIDPAGVVRFANAAAGRFLGHAHQGLVGQEAGIPLLAGETTQFEFGSEGSGRNVAELHVIDTEWEGQPAYLAILSDITTRKRAEESLQKRTAQLETMRQVGLELAAELDLETLLHSISASAIVLVGGEFSTVALYRPDKDALEWTVAVDPEPTYLGHITRRGEGLAGRIWEIGKALVVEDYSHWEGRETEYDTSSWGAMIGVPIYGGEEFLGVLEVEDKTVRTYSDGDVELLNMLAAQAAVVIQNARLHEQVQRHAQDLEERVSQRTAELEAKNRELSSFSYSVSHDLKAPLRGIDGYSQLLQESLAGRITEEERIFLQNIRKGVNQMSELIDDLLDYSRLERQSITYTQVDLNALVHSIQSNWEEELRQRKIEITVRIPFRSISADAEGLAQALRNLIDNAIEFTRDVPAPHIEVGGLESDRAYLVWVRDNGIGFDMQYQARIFEVFQRLQRSEDFPGTGIGLAIVRKTMQRMGGRVWADSAPGAGATFYLEIPKAGKGKSEE